MTTFSRIPAIALGAVAATLLLASCRTEVSGIDIDPAHWHQVHDIEIVVWDDLAALGSPDDLAALEETAWGEGEDPTGLGLEDGGAAIYDVESDGTAFSLGVFISSGPRPGFPVDAEGTPGRPSQVYTCFGVSGDVRGDARRELFDRCPDALVELLPSDAAFARNDEFDG